MPLYLGLHQQTKDLPVEPKGELAFFSIEPGDRWVRYYEHLGYPACHLSQVAGSGEFSGHSIRVSLLDEGTTFKRPEGWTFVNRHNSRAPKGLADTEAATAEVRAQFATNSRAIPSSWREEPFVSDSGAHGLCLSFIEQYPVPNPKLGGTTIMTQAVHDYILTNAQQRCVLLRYVTVAPDRSDTVRQMIQRTLRLEP
jgi:hypothetical protein